MIGYGWKGPFYVWEVETDEEKKEAEAEIARINGEMVAEADKKIENGQLPQRGLSWRNER